MKERKFKRNSLEADEGKMLLLKRALRVKEVRKNREKTSFTLDILFREKCVH